MEDLDALEDLQGHAFKTAVSLEDRLWRQALKGLPTSTWLASMKRFQKTAWPGQRKYAHVHFRWQGRVVSLQQTGGPGTQTVWISGGASSSGSDGSNHWNKEGVAGVGFSTTSAHFFTLEDIGSGSEHLELTMWEWPAASEKTNKPTKVWQKAPVGPSVVLHEGRCYFSSVENMLRYPDVRRVDIATGKEEHVLYRQPNKRIQVTLTERAGAVFVHEANAIFQRLGELKGGKIRWLTPVLESTLVPISPTLYATDRCLNHVTTKTCWPLPEHHHIQDAVQGPEGSVLVSTVRDGTSALWVLKDDTWSLLWTTEGEMSDVQILHEPTLLPTFLLRRPSRPDEVAVFAPAGPKGAWGLKTLLVYPEPLPLKVLAHGLAGPSEVPYTVVSCCGSGSDRSDRGAKKPRALLVEAYGAYGMSGRRAYPVRWLPWLAAGYAMAYVAPRGGREKGDPWWDGGRTAQRKVATFLDTAAAIKQIQTDVGIPAERTVFFGRSAGGWLAANIAQAHGDLVAAVYAEVPYVDVLATTSNPKLPLTQLEYDEFGDPVHRPKEKTALERISPVDTVPAGGPTSPLLVIRTGLHDAQVFPYEALKWSRALRTAGWTRVYVGIDHDGGHFAGPDVVLRQRAEDAALLDSAVQGPRGRRQTRKSDAYINEAHAPKKT